MSSPASVKNHPIHPMLIVFPIGLWVFSIICHVVFLVTGGPNWNIASLYALGGGIVGAVLAVIPGFVDLFSMPDGKVRQIGIWHMSINLITATIFAVAFGLRLAGMQEDTAPLILSVIALLLLGVSGWLGGEMVYVHGVGVSGHEHLHRPKGSGHDEAQAA